MNPEDRVREELRDAAGAYEPDRTAIVDRVAAGRSATRSGRDRMRPAGAALAVVAVVAVSVLAARLNSGPEQSTAANPGPPPAAATGPSAVPATMAPSTAAPGRTTGSSSSATAKSFLTADGAIDQNSVATWTQHTVTVRTSKPVAGLRLTITVALTPGMRSAGRYTTAPNADLTMDVQRTADALVYSYALDDGVQLAPGSYEFGAQFDHRSGRSTAGDSYAIEAHTETADAEQSGRFG